MKSWKVVTGGLLVMAGFVAGSGLNFLPAQSVVRIAPNDPNPALKVVDHDSTLMGDGTPRAPLGIANGGVSARKLSTATAPTAGQILGFNGANLAWQNAPVGGVRVVDSAGRVVGPFTNNYAVLRQVGSFLFAILVSALGLGSILQPGDTVSFFHTTTDCSGPRYFTGYYADTDFIRGSYNLGTQQFYAADPIQQITINSFEKAISPVSPNTLGTCFKVNPYQSPAGLVATIDLTTPGFTPPFHLEF